jgi:hypothetical protein
VVLRPNKAHQDVIAARAANDASGVREQGSLPTSLTIALTDALGDQPGWRSLALPRLRERTGRRTAWSVPSALGVIATTQRDGLSLSNATVPWISTFGRRGGPTANMLRTGGVLDGRPGTHVTHSPSRGRPAASQSVSPPEYRRTCR